MSSKTAFTLLELAIVLLIIGMVAAGGLTMLVVSTKSQQVNGTVAKMEKIEAALLNYSITFGRLPCPASLTIAADAVNYGVEAANKGSCTGGTPAANFSASGMVEGGVPVRTLQLSDDMMYDGWGRRFRFTVNANKTAANTIPVSSGGCTSTTITVKDASGASRSTNAIYTLISHGANGHGGYTKNGAIFNAASMNTDELVNCHCDSSAVATTYGPTYVAKLPTNDSTSALNSFDDIVTFKEGWQLQTQNVVLGTSSTCRNIYVSDTGNHRVLKFDSDGNFLMGIGAGYNGIAGTIGSSGTALGQFNSPAGIGVTTTGFIWVADRGNHRLQMFNSAGTWWNVSGAGYNSVAGTQNTAGSGNGQFNSPYGIAINPSGTNEIWVADYNNNRVQYLQVLGVYGSQENNSSCSGTCYNLPKAVAPRGSNYNWYSNAGSNQIAQNNYTYTGFGSTGTGNVQFNSPDAIAVDPLTGNLWIAESGNNRVQQVTTAGVFVSQFPCASGACATAATNGQFNRVGGIAVDASGTLWVTDTTNNRIQKMTSTGSYISQLGCATGNCAAGTGNTQLSAPTYIFVQ